MTFDWNACLIHTVTFLWLADATTTYEAYLGFP